MLLVLIIYLFHFNRCKKRLKPDCLHVHNLVSATPLSPEIVHELWLYVSHDQHKTTAKQKSNTKQTNLQKAIPYKQTYKKAIPNKHTYKKAIPNKHTYIKAIPYKHTYKKAIPYKHTYKKANSQHDKHTLNEAYRKPTSWHLISCLYWTVHA